MGNWERLLLGSREEGVRLIGDGSDHGCVVVVGRGWSNPRFPSPRPRRRSLSFLFGGTVDFLFLKAEFELSLLPEKRTRERTILLLIKF